MSLIAFVHDEFLFRIPRTIQGTDLQTIRLCIASLMETSPFPLRVPIRCNIGFPERNWSKAGKNQAPVMYKDFGLTGPLSESVAEATLRQTLAAYG